MGVTTRTRYRRLGRDSIRPGDYHSEIRTDAEFDAVLPPPYEVAGVVEFRGRDGHDYTVAVIFDATAEGVPPTDVVDVDDRSRGAFYREQGAAPKA